MASLSPSLVRGVSKASLEALLAQRGPGAFPAAVRYDALARYEELPARSAARTGRGWKHDLAKLDLSELVPFGPEIIGDGNVNSGAESAARGHGVRIERLGASVPELLGKAVDTRDDKFASLALAFQNGGTYVEIPAGVQLDEPIEIDYRAEGAAAFPYTLIVLGEGARATIRERMSGHEFVCGITEIVAGARSHVSFVAEQRLSSAARSIMTRRATLGADARLDACLAELGSELSVSRFRSIADARGAQAQLTALFFANGDQHVDLESEVVHADGNTRSETVVRSAGIGRGQGRYLGNIRIVAHAHGSDASLRDDALLLSEGAHIDSVPALEIAANDVKAYHGATVGAISEDELFYAQSRGIARNEAERMIALGFFEPAVARFPGESLREGIRVTLAAKLDAPA